MLFKPRAHLPAIAVALPGAQARMMAKPGGFVRENGISVNFDKIR